MRIVDVLQPDKKDVHWIVENFKEGLLIVDDSFQRNYVWLEKHQIGLIETILLGYAIPEIYLWAKDTKADTGKTVYSIVDGQQRIGAVFNYIGGKYKLRKAYLSEKDSKYADKYFSELSDELKKSIWTYAFTVRHIPKEINRDEIVKMFLRLNSTDKSLNPQELRNAEFNGEFLKNAKEISKLDFWIKNDIFSSDDIRRMKDIEFISSLLIFLRNGIESEITQKMINKMYNLFNDEYDEKENDYNLVIKILDEIQKVIDYDNSILIVLSRTTHLYALFTLSYIIVSQGKEYLHEQKEKLVAFYKDYNNDSNSLRVEKYKEYSKDATKSKQSRLGRLKVLRELLEV